MWVDLPDGIIVEDDGIKYTIELGNNTSNGHYACFGMKNKLELEASYSYSNALCT